MADFGDEITGLCAEMCPEAERIEREKHRRLSIFEILHGTEKSKRPKTDSRICVKEYSRSAAGRKIDTSRLRPPEVLLETTHYLVNEILDKEKHGRSWLEAYNFVADRMRAVIQDMIILRANARVSITILQKAVRLHILFMHELRNERDFDKKLCFEQLCSYISSLLMHVNNSEDDFPTHSQKLERKQIQKEFSAYYMLLHFNSEQAIQYFLSKPDNFELLKTHPMHELVISKTLNDFVDVFRAIERLPYLHSCCIAIHINALRIDALKIIVNAYASKRVQFPVSILKNWLKFDREEDTVTFCEKLQFPVKEGLVTFSKSFNPDLDVGLTSLLVLVNNKKKWSIKDYVSNKNVPG